MQTATKNVLMQLIPLAKTGWSKLAFHFYIPSENEFDCSLYFGTEDGKYTDVLTLVNTGLCSKAELDHAFWAVIEILRNKYLTLPENQRWSGLTLLCSSDFRTALFFEYYDINYGLTKEWENKYLQK